MVQLVGFRLKKITAEIKSEIKGKIDIKSNLVITDIKEESIEISKDKTILGFYFNFQINYNPNVANLSFEGMVLNMCSNKESKDILKEWKKKKINEGLRLLIYNHILLKCSVKALQYEEDFNLPFHIPMPIFSAQNKATPEQIKELEKGKDRDYAG
jgi:hypothetical protein